MWGDVVDPVIAVVAFLGVFFSEGGEGEGDDVAAGRRIGGDLGVERGER